MGYWSGLKRLAITLAGLLIVFSLIGCASFRGEAPRLNVVNLKVVEATPLEQRYQVRLRVQEHHPEVVVHDVQRDLSLADRTLHQRLDEEVRVLDQLAMRARAWLRPCHAK